MRQEMSPFPETPYAININTLSGSCIMEFLPTEWHMPANTKLTGNETAIQDIRNHFSEYSLGMWGYPIERLEFCSPMDIHANLTTNKTCYRNPLIRSFEIIGYVPSSIPPELHPDNHDPDDEDGGQVLESALDDTIHQEAATSPNNDLPEPTLKEKEAGNYKKAHITIQGLEIAVENPAGSERSGVGRDGKKWTSKLHHHYGYIKGTKGRDKDHLDVFLGPDPETADKVFIVNQTNPDSGVFDEHKILLGFSSEEEARTAYLSNYEEGWQGLGSICPLFMDEFKDWLKNGDTTIAVERGAAGSYRQDAAWIGIDLDGTLARYDGWAGENHIGEPVPLMMAFVKNLIAEGRTVKIFTARAADPEKIKPVELWLEENGLGGIEVTNVKDHNMTMLYDDRAAKVIPNTGVVIESARGSAIFERGPVPDFHIAVEKAVSFDDIENVFADTFGPIVVRKFISGEISDLEKQIRAKRDKMAQLPGDEDGGAEGGIAKGGKTTAYLNDNSPVELQYAVIEAERLVTSHTDEMSLNKDFSQDLQPRDRAREGMKLQVEQMAGKLNPERLGESRSVSTGAPIVGQDLTVESGNGRTIAIRKAYSMGAKGQEYKRWLVDNAGQFGVSGKTVEGMKTPILVRIRLTEIDRAEFARKANEDEIAQMAPSELARADAAKLTDDDVALFQPSDDGNIAAISNRPFITRFFEKMGSNAATGYMTKDGSYTKQLVDRVQAAIFQKAYQDDHLLALMSEEADPKIKNILGAMTIAAGEFSRAKAVDPSLMGIDIPRHVIEAANLIKKSREDNQAIDEALAQGGLFEEISEDTKQITLFIDKNIRSARRMGGVFKESARLLRRILIDEKEPKLLDTGEPLPTAAQVVALAIEREVNSREGGSLFEVAYDWRTAIEAATSFEDIAAVFAKVFGTYDVAPYKIKKVGDANVIEVSATSKIDRGFKVLSQFPELDAPDLFDPETVSTDQAKQIGKRYYEETLVPNPIESPAFTGKKVYFDDSGLQHINGEDGRPLSENNIKRRLKLLPKVAALLKSTAFVDEVRQKDETTKEYGLLGRFSDGAVIRVVVDETEQNGKHFLSVFDWEDMSKKLKKAPIPNLASRLNGYVEGKAPSVQGDSLMRPPTENVKLEIENPAAYSTIVDFDSVWKLPKSTVVQIEYRGKAWRKALLSDMDAGVIYYENLKGGGWQKSPIAPQHFRQFLDMLKGDSSGWAKNDYKVTVVSKGEQK